ncbi:Crp/Fnr family transcriptional regulator [Aurantimonas sp. VKM B-3413]|uniref:Crp/Fnr family transcriptional regulator n=1 Tax=Aurantimonas sp. VKM B-3413 TaxID=2779401 RepID=UPI001E374332|nr:Crp/Fnr family transcriptional regulator [Aurantimonas sp. VKM B-3413]
MTAVEGRQDQLDRSVEDRERLLGSCVIFQALDERNRRELASYAFTRRYQAGDPIFQMGSPGQSMMAIVVGTVRISVITHKAREIVLTDLNPGEVFGEMALIDGGERSAAATALTNCTLLVLERRDVFALLERHPKSALKLLELLCHRLRRSDERMTELAFLEIPARLAKALLRAIESPGCHVGKQGAKLAMSQTELANIIGSSRENVNRCLKAWQRRGLVDLRNGWLIVPDKAALEALAVEP